MNKKLHVIPYGEEWALRVEGNTKVDSIYRTKTKAISAAQGKINSKSSDLIIHSRNGKPR